MLMCMLALEEQRKSNDIGWPYLSNAACLMRLGARYSM